MPASNERTIGAIMCPKARERANMRRVLAAATALALLLPSLPLLAAGPAKWTAWAPHQGDARLQFRTAYSKYDTGAAAAGHTGRPHVWCVNVKNTHAKALSFFWTLTDGDAPQPPKKEFHQHGPLAPGAVLEDCTTHLATPKIKAVTLWIDRVKASKK